MSFIDIATFDHKLTFFVRYCYKMVISRASLWHGVCLASVYQFLDNCCNNALFFVRGNIMSVEVMPAVVIAGVVESVGKN